MVIAIPGIFRFSANCHAPSVLLSLLVAEGSDGFAKRSVNFTIGKLIDRLKAFARFVSSWADGGIFTAGFSLSGLSLALWPKPSNLSPGGKPSRLPFYLARAAWALWALRSQSAAG